MALPARSTRMPKGTPGFSTVTLIMKAIALMVRSCLFLEMRPRARRGTARRLKQQSVQPSLEPAVQRGLQAGRISWWAPILMLVARPMFALVVQLGVAAGFRLTGHTKPVREAGRWWMVSGTLIDLLSLGTLTWLTRREGLRLVDLLNMRRERLGRQLRHAPGDLVALAPGIGLGAALTRLFYGSSAQPPQVAVARGLPWAASVYSVLIWPVVWAAAEEATYLGYTLPRLEALTGNTPASMALVSAVWALQHEALPLLPDGRYLAYRPLSALPVTLTTTLLYLYRGRLLSPLMVAHWAADAGSGLFAALSQGQRDGTSVL